MSLNLTEVMDWGCIEEIIDRVGGDTVYGPPKIYTLAICD